MAALLKLAISAVLVIRGACLLVHELRQSALVVHPEDESKGRHGPPGFPLACVDGMTCPMKGRSPGTNILRRLNKTMMECWQDCLADERCLGAISHSNYGMCYLLARTYDEKFGEKECGTWVSNKDPSATCRGCDTSLESPEECPTPSPTAAPTPTGAATAFGDPHVGNLRGEKFDILQPDYHTFLLIPRGSQEGQALLHVRAKAAPLGPVCDGLLYLTELRFMGQWLGEVGSLDFVTAVDGEMDAQKSLKIKAGNSTAFLNVSAFQAAVPEELAEVTEIHPEKPVFVNQRVDTLLVKLKLGPSIANVRMVHQKEKSGFSNALWFTSMGLKNIKEEIGGILGFDEHKRVAMPPRECLDDSSRMPKHAGTMHAFAYLDEES